jgi:dipeptidyl aminopeptidase/acylaminoacyl peptidase
MKNLLFLILIFIFSGLANDTQAQKKPLDYKVYDSWKSLSSQRISDNGGWLSWVVNPAEGDGQLFIQNVEASSPLKVINRGAQPTFDPASAFVAFKINAQADSVRKAKINKAKPEKMPKDTLGILVLSTNELQVVPLVKSFKVPDEGPSWIAYQLDEQKTEAVKPEKKDSAAPAKKADDKSKKKPEYNGTTLYVLNPVVKDTQKFQVVTEYGFSKKGNVLYMASIAEDSVKTSTIRLLDTQSGKSREIFSQTGVAKSLVADESGTRLSFLFTTDTAKTKVYSLYLWNEKDGVPVCIADTLTKGMPLGWSVSENGRMTFSPDGRRLFFSTAKKPEIKKDVKDTLLAEDKVSVDIWHWKEDVLQSIQLKQADQDAKRSYQAVYNIKQKQMLQLGYPDSIENYRLVQQGDLDLAMGIYDGPYRWFNSINSESYKDVYLLDLNSGKQELVFKNIRYSPSLSPNGNYMIWWQPADSSWYCYGIKSKQTVNLTHHLPVRFVNEEHDTPDEPGSFGLMGWEDKDQSLYLYDQFDIWRMDPEGKRPAECVTGSYGRKGQLSIRYNSLDPEEKYLDPKKEYLFSVTNEKNKQSGYVRFRLSTPQIRSIVMDNCKYAGVSKAKNADRLIWTRSSVAEYPDFWISDLDFKGARKISNANPQQKDYIWASVELVEWLDLNGEMHQGLLYKPENMDPARKYPMIVYFYERHSDGLHTHYTPRFSASTVNPVEYASNGYLVFMPDIHFIIGNPGKSFYNAIMSGILYLDQRGNIDMKHLGIQGQSWGGYGTAFMITQTDIFAAASPGAPVSNMTSAYGGIRNESGMVRQFQYEKSQSRIGGTLWEKPEYFIENSPLFFADRINTPCLIRHDDGDGAVPFSEGVQLFAALRRLGKPAWLVNYNNQPHNLSRQSDKKDWSIRMMQFFNHYLKGEPAPDWMVNGVKAVDKKKNETFYWSFTE